MDYTAGHRESDSRDGTLAELMGSLVPSYKEVLSPIPLPTYSGKVVIPPPDLASSSNTKTTHEDLLDKDFFWSKGRGFELSLLKTMSARWKEAVAEKIPDTISTTTQLELGALRGIKALARSK